MEDRELPRILESFASPQSQKAWEEFLELYSPLILQAVRFIEYEPDHVSDCFLFVCERLSANQFRRLRSFRIEGSAKFSTWLRVVIRNLCLDWRRKEFGRLRLFQSIARLDPLDQEIYRFVFEQGLQQQDCLAILKVTYPQLTIQMMEDGVRRVRGALSERQLWLAGTRRRPASLELDRGDEDQAPRPELTDSGPDPELLFVQGERREALQAALNRLSKPDRLLIRLRFEQGLTLQDSAALLGLKDAQTADRTQREIIEKLRQELADFS